MDRDVNRSRGRGEGASEPLRPLPPNTPSSTRSSTKRRKSPSSPPKNFPATSKPLLWLLCKPTPKTRASSSPLTTRSTSPFLEVSKCTLSLNSWTCHSPAAWTASLLKSASSDSELTNPDVHPDDQSGERKEEAVRWEREDFFSLYLSIIFKQTKNLNCLRACKPYLYR